MELLFIWMAFAIVTALAASGRGRNAVGWLFIGLLTGIFGLIAVLVLPRVEAQSAPQRNVDEIALQGSSKRYYKGFEITPVATGGVRVNGNHFPGFLSAERAIDEGRVATSPTGISNVSASAPPQTDKPLTALEVYRGVQIEFLDDEFFALGKGFDRIAAARAYIDSVIG